MSVWLSLGSSPTAPAGLRAARQDFDFDMVITTNAGIKLIPDPDVYLLHDAEGCRIYREPALEAQRGGTRLITFQRHPDALRDRGVTHFDEFIPMDKKNGVLRFERSQYSRNGYSGNYITQYAAMHRAKTIVLVGHDGYCPEGWDHWDGTMTQHKSNLSRNQATTEVIQPFFRRMAEIWPEIEFVQYGKPNFQVGNPNWRVVEVTQTGELEDERDVRDSRPRREQGSAAEESVLPRRRVAAGAVYSHLSVGQEHRPGDRLDGGSDDSAGGGSAQRGIGDASGGNGD